MDEQQAKELLDKYNAGQCTDEEKALLETWYLRHNQELPHGLSDGQITGATDRIFERLGREQMKVRRLPLRYAAAASIILAAGITAYFALHKTPAHHQQVAAINPEQLLPAKQGVTLTLGNGKQVLLHAVHHGPVQASTAIQQDSLLSYRPQAAVQAELNTVTNNSGAKFSLKLADGSEVTLDVQSSLTYPVAFTAKDREVTVTGQAYFQVKHDAAHPFRVKAESETIEDIGTEFNVNTYEMTQTTLVSGAIAVNHTVLKPGQMAEAEGDHVNVQAANLREVTAWLQDKIKYKDATLEHIMNDVARIYQVKLIWLDPQLKQRAFGVTLNRSTPLANILNYFRKTSDIDFKMEGKTLSIFKKKTNN